MPDPSSGEKEFVELYNSGTSTIDLSGWTLTDLVDNAGSWKSRSIASHSFVVVEFATKLNNGGDTLILKDASGALVDKHVYTSSVDGKSWSRMPDGGFWSKQAEQPSPGSTNDPTTGSGNEAIVINEIMPDPSGKEKEFVELYNSGTSTIDLSEWTLMDLVDNAGSWSSRSIASRSFVVVEFATKLNNGGDTLILKDASGALVDKHVYTSSVDGKSWSRLPDGGPWSTGAQQPSPGSTNGESTSPSPPPSPAPPVRAPCGGTCGEGVCFGTWNIQNFGSAKAGRPAVMDAIRLVLARYDLAAIQELSQKPEAPYVCGDFTEAAICASNPDPTEYVVSASPRIGDEQYVVMARRSRVSVAGSGQTYPDPSGKHSRPPHAFDVTVTHSSSPWRLVVATTHTAPDHAEEEILNFPSVLQWMKDKFGGSDAHHLIAGDFNADGSYFGDDGIWQSSRLGSAFAGYTLLTNNDLDTTVAVSSNAYDRIIVDDSLASTSGSPAVFRLEEVDLSAVRKEGCQDGYVPDSLCGSELDGVSWADVPSDVKTNLAKEISDHHPVEVCLRP